MDLYKLENGLLDNLKESALISKGLICDMVADAKSGHLGAALGCAYIGAALFGKLLNFSPNHPRWINRDRFVLSCGHASAFLYTWLHLSGYNITLDDLKNFRKSHSNTPGHPEFGITPGVECTTGPLGQGIANAVGLALSSKKLESVLNQDKPGMINNRVVCLTGDGCLQEGISFEACSLAGHWCLDNLIIIYDSNNVTLDGKLSSSQSDDIKKRFDSFGFDVTSVQGDDIKSFIYSYNEFHGKLNGRPKLLIVNTVIGDGIPEISGTNKAHGEAGVKFILESKKKWGLPDQKYFVSDGVKQFFRKQTDIRSEQYDSWGKKFGELEKKWIAKTTTNVNINFDCIKFPQSGVVSTRVANSDIMQKLADQDDLMITGSADLFSSNKNYLLAGSEFSSENYLGRNIQYGIREHAMGAITNGICYDGYFHSSCATFLVFSDYMRTPIRIAALSNIHNLFLFTHDSIAVGPDGPTHQPVETIASLRCIPNLYVVRPADCEELVGAWQLYYKMKIHPFAFILSRQDLKIIDTISIDDRRMGVLRGAYIAKKETEILRCIVISCGSELSLALEAAKGFNDVRVVSMPCMKQFDAQSQEYKEHILPKDCKHRVVVEAGVAVPWYKYAGTEGIYICVENFGFSGSQEDLYRANGLTVDNILKAIGE